MTAELFGHMLILLLLACADTAPPPDTDGDGHSADDCDDADPDVHPGAVEVPYDGIDQDCKGGDDLDRDGDGAAYTDDCDDGAAEVFAGADDPCGDGIDGDCDGADPLCTWPAEVDLDATAYRWTGAAPTEELGHHLGVGDVTGDGVDDLVVMGTDAYVFSAPLPEVGVAAQVATVLPLASNAESLAVGDLDQDGIAEVVVGGVGASIDGGADWDTEDGYPCAGDSLVVGDVTGDGVEDLVVAAPCVSGEQRGRVYVADAAGGDLGASAAILTGEAEDLLGWDVATPGDLDGDGVGDLAAVLYAAAGPVACAWMGGLRGDLRRVDAETCWRDDLAVSAYYLRVSGAGDADGDGRADLVLRNGHAAETGLALVFVGVEPGLYAYTSAWALLTGDATGDLFGVAGGGVGDLDGDGWGDLAFGAPGQDDGGNDGGGVAVWYGPIAPGAHAWGGADALLLGGERGAGAGARLAAGDFGGEGGLDLAVSALEAGEDDDTYGTSEGAVHVVVDHAR